MHSKHICMCSQNESRGRRKDGEQINIIIIEQVATRSAAIYSTAKFYSHCIMFYFKNSNNVRQERKIRFCIDGETQKERMKECQFQWFHWINLVKNKKSNDIPLARMFVEHFRVANKTRCFTCECVCFWTSQKCGL